MHQFISPIKIVTGPGSIAKAAGELQQLGIAKVMIFADPGVVKFGIVGKLEDVLKQGGIDYEIYKEIVPEPPLHVANQAVEALRSSKAELVIGIGGGSCLDIAKAAAVLCANEGTAGDYLNLSGTRKFTVKGLPKILIPTTSGTGAEVTDITVFSLPTTKDVITHPYLLADVAIIDSELTYSLPPRITAATGVDALTHAVEALISINASPLTDTLALEAIRRISSHIRTAVWHGSNVTARSELSWGSLLAGMSFYNAGVSGVHALAYPLGGLFKMAHGESNAVMLPYVFDYIWPACIDKLTLMTEALGIQAEFASKRDAAIACVKELRNIVRDVGLPLTLQSYSIGEEHLEQLAQEAMKQTRLLARSPMPYTLETTLQIYRAAYNGELLLGG